MLDKNSPFTRKQNVEGKNLTDLACKLLTTAIVEGDPCPGSVLSEAAISARFGIGLAATRTALARLSATGWVEAKDRSGWKVQPMSPAHLADLQSSRRWLEPALPGSPCPQPLSTELRLQADIHESTSHASSPLVLLHQERALLSLIAQAVAAPRLRRWLTDTWDLALRTDHVLGQNLGIVRPPLPLHDLARAKAHVDADVTARILETMRAEFEARIAHALSRSDASILESPASTTLHAAAGTKRAPTDQRHSFQNKGDGA